MVIKFIENPFFKHGLIFYHLALKRGIMGLENIPVLVYNVCMLNMTEMKTPAGEQYYGSRLKIYD